MDMILSCSCIKVSKMQTKNLDSVDTGVLISDFIQHWRQKNVHVPHIYFILLHAAGISPSLVFNHNAKAKDRGSWLPLKFCTSKAARIVYARCCCLRFCTQLGKNWQNTSIKAETVFTFKGFLYKSYIGNTKIQENGGFC